VLVIFEHVFDNEVHVQHFSVIPNALGYSYKVICESITTSVRNKIRKEKKKCTPPT
jgi:hypothetical protein